MTAQKRIHVIITGLEGSGKSTVISMLHEMNREQAAIKYVESEVSPNKFPQTYKSLRKEIQRNDDKLCIIFVLKKDRITSIMNKVKASTLHYLNKKGKSVLACITWCDTEEDEKHWWDNNKEEFLKYNFRFKEIVAGCARGGKLVAAEFADEYEKKRNSFKDKLQSKIEQISKTAKELKDAKK